MSLVENAACAVLNFLSGLSQMLLLTQIKRDQQGKFYFPLL